MESISGLSPAIAIDQKTTSRNPRSTVGTITEVYDYLKITLCKNWHTIFSCYWLADTKPDSQPNG